MIVSCSECVRPDHFCTISPNRRSETTSCFRAITKGDLHEAICSSVCAWCGGACCHRDRTGTLPKHYLERYDLPQETDRCPAFDHNIGCVLPREGRPIVCLEYECCLIQAAANDRVMWENCQVHGRIDPQHGITVFCRNCPNWNNCQYNYREFERETTP